MIQIGLGDPLVEEALRMTLRAEVDGNRAGLAIARDEARVLQSIKGNNLTLRENLENYIHSTKKREYIQIRIMSALMGINKPDSCFRLVIGRLDFEEGIDAIGTTRKVRYTIDLTSNKAKLASKIEREKQNSKSIKVIAFISETLTRVFEEGFQSGIQSGLSIEKSYVLGIQSAKTIGFSEQDIEIYIPQTRVNDIRHMFPKNLVSSTHPRRQNSKHDTTFISQRWNWEKPTGLSPQSRASYLG